MQSVFIFPLLLCLMLNGLCFANEIKQDQSELKSGLYELVDEGQGVAVNRTDRGIIGEQLHIGRWLTDQFTDAIMISSSNDNKVFKLTLTTSEVPINERRRHGFAFIHEGQCLYAEIYNENDHQAQNSGKKQIGMNVHGMKAVNATATWLNITDKKLRTHPGHQLVATLRPVNEASQPEQPVTLNMSITNQGQTPIRFVDGGSNRGSRNNQFSFIAYKGMSLGSVEYALPDTGNPDHSGGIEVFITLKAGETFSKKVRLTDWFRFSKAGTYQIISVYPLQMMDEQWQVIWDDFATAQCPLLIRWDAPASKTPPPGE